MQCLCNACAMPVQCLCNAMQVCNLTCMTTEEWHVKTTPNKSMREAVRASMVGTNIHNLIARGVSERDSLFLVVTGPPGFLRRGPRAWSARR